jgi:RNA polymerase sigma factor (sigma-70 family)
MVATTTRDDLATLFSVGAVGQLSDAELLTRFTAGQGDAVSDAAFEVIVARHGPMVLGVCRRVLGDAHAAADAFQTTFLVLSRNAISVHIEDSLGRWLYGVSIRVARRARAIALAERARVLALNEFDPPDEGAMSDPCQHDDLRTAIDEEIARLPGRYRSAVVLCYLEGLTQGQAARRLRCPLGTIQSRLHRARERLRSGLCRRGLAPTSWSSATLAATTGRAEVPPKLTAAIVSAGGRLAPRPAPPSTIARTLLPRSDAIYVMPGR